MDNKPTQPIIQVFSDEADRNNIRIYIPRGHVTYNNHDYLSAGTESIVIDSLQTNEDFTIVNARYTVLHEIRQIVLQRYLDILNNSESAKQEPKAETKKGCIELMNEVEELTARLNSKIANFHAVSSVNYEQKAIIKTLKAQLEIEKAKVTTHFQSRQRLVIETYELKGELEQAKEFADSKIKSEQGLYEEINKLKAENEELKLENQRLHENLRLSSKTWTQEAENAFRKEWHEEWKNMADELRRAWNERGKRIAEEGNRVHKKAWLEIEKKAWFEDWHAVNTNDVKPEQNGAAKEPEKDFKESSITVTKKKEGIEVSAKGPRLELVGLLEFAKNHIFSSFD